MANTLIEKSEQSFPPIHPVPDHPYSERLAKVPLHVILKCPGFPDIFKLS